VEEQAMSIGMASAFTAAENDARTRSFKKWSEESLVAAAKCGQKAAFGQLCQRHAKHVFRAIHRITRSREDTEDAVQDSLLNALVHLQDFDGRSEFATWLTRIAINSALMRIRKGHALREVPMDESRPGAGYGQHHYVPDSAPNPKEVYRLNERKDVVSAALGGLLARARKVVEFHKLKEYSLEETAQILGISRAAVKARMFHARVELRRVLQRNATAHHRERRIQRQQL
jgi:RNA polymerase sigma factor (sigma-70 family)